MQDQMRLTHKVSKPPAAVFDYLANMEKFASVHPVINKVKELGGNNYLVFETLSLWLFNCSFTYPAIISSNEKLGEITMTATVRKL